MLLSLPTAGKASPASIQGRIESLRARFSGLVAVRRYQQVLIIVSLYNPRGQGPATAKLQPNHSVIPTRGPLAMSGMIYQAQRRAQAVARGITR